MQQNLVGRGQGKHSGKKSCVRCVPFFFSVDWVSSRRFALAGGQRELKSRMSPLFGPRRFDENDGLTVVDQLVLVERSEEGEDFMANSIRVVMFGLSVASAYGFVSRDSQAGFMFIGPTPYLSTDDSPFPANGINADFFLEDFEPDPGCVPDEFTICGGGKFDAPGAEMIFGGAGHGYSVDADDGLIDGLGTNGASGGAVPVSIIGASSLFAISFSFDPEVLGFLPTAVGIVLTDGAGESSALSAYDAQGNSGIFTTSQIDLNPHSTLDDRFVGVINPDGISRIELVKRVFDSNPSAPPRIDHLQYGLLIPEPDSIGLTYIAVVLLVVGYCRTKQRAKQRGQTKGTFYFS